jgi:Dolichyl-phosphate-mannose-protein mannosyltransferase
MIVAALAPLLTLGLLVIALRPRVENWRMAALAAAVLEGAVMVVFTEALSLLGALNASGMLAVWVALSGFLAWRVWRDRGSVAWGHPLTVWPGGVDGFLLLSVGALIGLLGVLAVITPPNTYDSMTYHMSRVVHWIQNGSLAHYPTSIGRQLFLPPGAEFAILHLQLLTRGDRLANLVQWSSLVGSLTGVSLAAKQLGGDRRAQILAAVVAATLPMGIMQASSTQNDYVVSFWLVCLVVFVLHLNRQPPGSGLTGGALVVGAALGLALLTKPTAYVFAFPFMIWMALARTRRDGVRAWGALILVILVALALNAGHYRRNIATFGAPLGPRVEATRYLNATFDVPSLVSVAVRNVVLHLGTRWSEVNRLTARMVDGVHRFLGLDVNDSATTADALRLRVSRPPYHEDVAANGWHVALAMVALAALVVVSDLRRQPPLVTYAGLLVTAFVLFCLILRWQPWHSRLQLPLFVLGAPVVGIVLARRPLLGRLVACGLLGTAVPWVLFSETKPVLGNASVFRRDREAQYFAMRPDLRQPYLDTVARLREGQCAAVGFLMDENGFEYPLWVHLGKASGTGWPRLEHIGILDQGGTALGAIGDARFRPCAVIATHPKVTEAIRLGEVSYRRVVPSLPLFLPDGRGIGAADAVVSSSREHTRTTDRGRISLLAAGTMTPASR